MRRGRRASTLPPTRGPSSLCTFKQVSRVLAGFPDGRAHEGVQAGPRSLVGLELAHQRGDTAPAYPATTSSQES